MEKMIKHAIADSFMKLCDDKPIKAITVKDIIDYCEISKQTFYNHFRDKYDLMNYIYQSGVQNILIRSENSNDSLKNSILGVFEMCFENKKYYTAIANFSVQNSFPQYFFEHTKDYYRNRFIRNYGKEALMKSIEMAIDFNCAGTEKLFVDWVKRGMKESPKYMTREVCNCMPPELRKYYFDDEIYLPDADVNLRR